MVYVRHEKRPFAVRQTLTGTWTVDDIPYKTRHTTYSNIVL